MEEPKKEETKTEEAKKEETKEEEKKEEAKEEKKEETKEETKKEDTKEETKKEDAKEEANEVEDAGEKGDVEVPVKAQVDEKVGLKNMVDDNFLLSTVTTWEQLGVKEEIKKGLLDMRFAIPSKIQSTTFPLIMKEPRTHLVAQAKNGSGKTAAFGLGVISSIDTSMKDIQAVVFAHTRELVIQIEDVLKKIAKFTEIKINAILTGSNEPPEYGQIIVMTPGHFENCFLKKNKDLLKNLKLMVLDEADFMLTNDVTSKIVDRTFNLFKKNKWNVQILFFSATFDTKCYKFIKRFYDNAYMIELQKEQLTLENVKQLYKSCKDPKEKVKFVEEYLKVSLGSERVIIFSNRRDNVLKLRENLLNDGYKPYILMGGDMALSNRDETIRRFRNGEIQILITTDVLARGYDEKLVKLVINYDLPVKKTRNGNFEPDCETYLHRIGRTGRFGTKGIAVNLCCGKRDMEIILSLEQYYKTKVEEMKSFDELIKELKKYITED